MKRRGLPVIFLFAATSAVLTAVACGNDPPPATPDTTSMPKSSDRTEVKMEVAATPDADVPAPPTSAAPLTTAAPTAAPSDPSDDPNIGGPQEAAVEKAVAPLRPRIRACYKKALAGQPDLKGSVTFDTVIGKDGKVTNARFVKKEALPDDMVGCLTAVVKAMQFAADRKSQVVALTFGTTSPTGGAKTPSSISSGLPTPPPAAPAASYGGSDAGPLRH